MWFAIARCSIVDQLWRADVRHGGLRGARLGCVVPRERTKGTPFARPLRDRRGFLLQPVAMQHPPPKSSPALGWRIIQPRAMWARAMPSARDFTRLASAAGRSGPLAAIIVRAPSATRDRPILTVRTLSGPRFSVISSAQVPPPSRSSPASKARTRTSRPTIPTIPCKGVRSDCDFKPRVGSIFPRAASLRRGGLWHGLPGILESCVGRLPPEALARHWRGRCSARE